VAVLEDSDPGAVEIPERLLCAAQHLLGEDRGTRREIELPQCRSSQ
jgi:hypothetical protein